MTSRSNPHQEELFKLAKSGNLAGIQQLFRDAGKDDSVHINLYARDRDHDRSALHWAVAKGHHPVVAYLIETDSSIGRAHALGTTSTDDAASPMLLDILDQPDHDGETMLFRSVENRDVEMARILLRHGAAVNVPCGSLGTTPLHYAVTVKRMAMVESLLAYNADVNAKGSEGHTPLMVAVAYQVSTNIVRVVLETGVDVNVNTADDNGNTALHFAATHKSAEVCALLLAHNADVNAKNRNGRTPIMEAVTRAGRSATDIVRTLLDEGVDVDVTTADDDGDTALHVAATFGSGEVCALLLAYNADVNAKNGKGRTPLMQTMAHKVSAGVVRILLEQGVGVDVNTANNNGETPLHFAAKNKSAGVCALLLAHNADVNAKNRNGRTPLMQAVARTESSATYIVRTLLDEGVDVDVNIADNSGCTALYFAVMFERAGLCSLLLARNADVNTKNSAGRTPLMLAATCVGESGADMVRILLEKGDDVDVNIANDGGYTPLYYAEKFKKHDVVEYLIRWQTGPATVKSPLS